MGHPFPIRSVQQAPSRPLSIAVICFMPDYGHLQPLLKIADALAAAGIDVKCYIASECAPLMKRFAFPFHTIESSAAAKPTRQMERMFAGGLFFNAVCLYTHYLLMYPRVGTTVARAADGLRRELAEQRPDLILCDGLWFVELYARMAAALRVPLVVNSFDGSLAYAQRDYVKIYGLAEVGSLLQGAVEAAAAVSRTLCKGAQRLRHARRWLEARATKRAVRRAFEAAFPVSGREPARQEWIVVGTAALERGRLAAVLRHENATRPEFAPLQFRSRLEVPPTLRAWIEGSDGTGAVYISFGSAVDLDEAFARAVYEGLRALPCRVLWSLPAAQQGLLDRCRPAANIRVEPFVPQAEILAMPGVRCFVTQAGPHSVQEALFGATPMLCIPFFVDQAYNASLISRLGAGLRLWKSDVSPGTIASAVLTVLRTPTFHQTVRDLSEEVSNADAGSSIVHYLTGMAQARSDYVERGIS